jgi:hypothetical protein
MPGLLMLMAIFMFGMVQLGIALDKLLVQRVLQELPVQLVRQVLQDNQLLALQELPDLPDLLELRLQFLAQLVLPDLRALGLVLLTQEITTHHLVMSQTLQ